MLNLKEDFPIFKNNPGLVYLDSAATSQKPKAVINSVINFYEKYNSNIHRGIYTISQTATDMYEDTRKKVAKFIGVKNEKEIIFTKNTNESINLTAFGWAKKFLKKGDIIILSEMEHHANIVPWIRLREEIGIKIVYLPITKDYRLNYTSLTTEQEIHPKGASYIVAALSYAQNDKNLIDFAKVKLVALTHASNVLGTVNPIKNIIKYFKKINPEIKFLIDAAQSIPHLSIDVQELDCDFLAFSSHKMLGPSGVGVLWAKKELLVQMCPMLVGSHMIQTVIKDNASWADIPDKFEAGTANLEGVIGLGTAIDYLLSIGLENIASYEKSLTEYALSKFKKHPEIILFGPNDIADRLGIFSFGITNIHPHDVAEILNRQNIAIRSGHHCAQVLMQALSNSATARASIYLYNTKEDIDRLFTGIEEVKKIFSS